jgi:hypothetical protein
VNNGGYASGVRELSVGHSTLGTASELQNDHTEKFSFFVLLGARAVEIQAALDEKCLFFQTILFRRNTSSIFFFS